MSLAAAGAGLRDLRDAGAAGAAAAPPDLVTAVLRLWCDLPRFMALAAVLHDTLGYYPLADEDTRNTVFADHQILPMRLLPPALRRDDESVFLPVVDLLWLLHAVPAADVPPLQAPDVMDAVKALFLLLFCFDIRVQRFVLHEDHFGHEVMQTRAPQRSPPLRRFLSRPLPSDPPVVKADSFVLRCERYVHDVIHLPPAAAADAGARLTHDFVDWARRTWQYGIPLME